MPRLYKEARLNNKMKLTEAAKRLEVSQPTLSSWESGRKSPSVESLEHMANLYGVSTDYLLGRELAVERVPFDRIPHQFLPVLHGKPVYVKNIGWGLVNAADNIILLTDGTKLPFSEAETTLTQDRFEESPCPAPFPISHTVLSSMQQEFWLEPISKDTELREQLRGWYRIRGNYAENEYGNRFSLKAYGATWLAFKNFI